jgi:putative acetyltransferase
MAELSVRALEPADALAIEAIAVQPEVARWLGGTPFDGVDRWRAKLEGLERESTVALGAFEGRALRGFAWLDGKQNVRQRHTAMLAIAVDGAHHRRGVGERLMRALIDAADRWYGWIRLELGVSAENAAAIALYRKHGFEIECRRKSDMFTDGRFADGLWMARIRPGIVPPPELGVPPPVRSRGAPIEVVVRARTTEDAEGFARLHETDSSMEGTLQLPFHTVQHWRKRFSTTTSGSQVLVADHAGRVVGSAGMFPLGQSPRMRHVMTVGMAVHPDFQGRGVGHALMGAITEHADQWLGLTRLELQVYVGNDRARALYERHGFVLEGTHRLYAFRRGTWVDAHHMARIRT